VNQRQPTPVVESSSRARMRVSVAALLRARVDDDLVLLDTGGGAVVGPPGGALTYHQATGEELASLGWQPERDTTGPLVDLRGTVPVSSFPAFVAWFETGTGRETSQDGLLREIREELAEVGMPGLVDLVSDARLAHVRTVVEGPTPTLVGTMMQTRRLALYDLLPCALADALAAFALDPAVPKVHAVPEAAIAEGYHGTTRIGTQAAYLAADWVDWPGATTLASPHGW
jgi:SMODS-associated NUDIX domain